MAKVDVTVHGVFYDDNDQVLLERTKKGWTLPGGHIERGQSVRDALKEELKQETGKKWDAKVGGLCGVHIQCDKKGMPEKIMFVVRGHRLSGKPQAKHEVKEVEWVSIEEARKRLGKRCSERWAHALEDSLCPSEGWPIFHVL